MVSSSPTSPARSPTPTSATTPTAAPAAAAVAEPSATLSAPTITTAAAAGTTSPPPPEYTSPKEATPVASVATAGTATTAPAVESTTFSAPAGSPLPPAAAAAPAAPAPTQPHADPKVAELQAIFPTVDVSVIELVLETCGGSTDRAIEQLLGMTDPNFQPDELSGTREDSQVDLDAEFARSLALQDQEEERRRQEREQQSGGFGGGVGSGQLPYQPRVRRARPPAPQQAHQPDEFYQPQGYGQGQGYGQRQEGENPPGMLAMEDRIERFAEAGKQTFNSFLSRAKAKYTEFQTAQAQNRANAGSPGQSNWGNSGGREDYAYGAPGGGRGGEQNRSGAQGGGFWGDTGSSSPSVRSNSFSSQSTLDPPLQPTAQPVRQQSKRWQPSDAFDDPLPPTRNAGSPSNRDLPGSVGSPDKGHGKIDPAKLGILPKKRVDLMSTSPQSSTLKSQAVGSSFGAAAGAGAGVGAASGSSKPQAGTDSGDESDPNPSLPSAPLNLVSKIPPTPPAGSPYRLEDSDDELEYTKNPFDEK
ncbi:hypothetical protein IAT38_008249 [Cryptococcus sp. DSM 104549]